jgi:alpha-glucosidase (family GH31 glycosyl hydrolase)
MRRYLIFALLCISPSFFVQAKADVATNGNALTWGINAITLRPPYSTAASLDELLTNQSDVVSLKQFYRAGGAGPPSEPTECHFAYNSDSLFVVFRCAETNLTFPAIRHNVNWYSLLGSPSEQDSAFPDKVDLFVRPDMNSPLYFQFTVTLDSLKFGCKRQLRRVTLPVATTKRLNLSSDEEKPATLLQSHSIATDYKESDESGTSIRFKIVTAFEANVVKKTNAWVVSLRIPWKTIGGKPRDYFGLLPVRTCWRDGEVSSPVAFDFTERPPGDLFIDTHFSGKNSVQANQTALCRLPSGILRWQRPALLTYPDADTIRRVWQMEQSLRKPTDKNNFAQRLYLTQRWTDLLTLEGFNFRPETGAIVEHNLSLFIVRREINAALQKNRMNQAYSLLDDYLKSLDKASRDWFADGSSGDTADNEWESISKLNSLDVKGNILLMRCLAGDHEINLHLSLPKTGGIRICDDNEGYFKPVGLLPLNFIKSSNSYSIETISGKINIVQRPFTILSYNAFGSKVMQIGGNDIAFHFGAGGKILAVDFKNHIRPDEVIYGFGERYDCFNENGKVLTLWGMDDWIGNTVGLMNESYKPIALFHSSKGYMMFDNSTYRLRADIGKTNPSQCRLTQQGSIFDYYFWIGSPETALESYTDLTGKPILPPKWAFGPWIGRTGRGWSNSSLHNPVAEEEKVVKRFAELDIPHSAIYAEGSSADSKSLNKFMAARGIKVLSWSYPVISERQQKSLMPELKPDELPILNAGNETASRELGYVDFTNPNALELCRRWWKHRLNIGVAGSMVDFGDRVPEGATFYNGEHGDEMHNFYAYDYHKTYSEVFREKRGKDFILFGRAAAPGTQKFVAQFAGDHPSNFAGLQAVLTGALNLCACGFSTWGSDLGGFLGWPEPAVYIRWTQFACFSPLMRSHGRTPREPWNYGGAAVSNYKYYAWVRENLLDYIYNTAAYSHETGIPMMRSMAIAYPEESLLAAVKDEYMFGQDLLVAPVITEENSRTISLPSGKWTSLWTGETVGGSTNFTSYVPLNTIPIYLKQGAIVPVSLNKALQFGESMTFGKVKALIVTPPDKEENLSLTDERIDKETVKLRPETNNSFVVELKNASEIGYLLVYGATTVSAVKVDGKNLPELVEKNFSLMPTGWQIDSTINRLVIRLPSRQTSQNGSLAKIEVKLQPKDSK